MGVFLLVIATLVVGSTAAIAATSADATVAPFYPRLVQMAEQGDPYARDFLQRVDALIARRGAPGAVNERWVEQRDRVGSVQVNVVGIEPFYLKIYNNITFQSHDHIRDYIIAREQALDRIVSSNPGGSVEVSISLHDYTPLNEVWRLKHAYHLNVDQMTLHLFVDGKRHSVLFVGDPVEPDDRQIVNFDAPVHQFETQLWSLLPASALDQQGIHPRNTSFKVSWLRGSLSTVDASLLKDHPAVMLVDPISDFLDQYRNRAVDVRVVQVPHLLSVVETVESLAQLRSQPPQPTPAPLKEGT